MNQKIQITIPEPCQEGWQNMTPVEKGRFCASCQKTVLDFTHLSDNEIINLVAKNDTLCGRINVSQLNRNLIETKTKSNYFGYVATSVLAFLGFGIETVVAQEKPVQEQTDLKYLNKASDSVEKFKISGTIIGDGNKLQNATITIKGTYIGTQSDENGKFNLMVKVGDTLNFSFLGFEEIEKVVDKLDLMNVQLNKSNTEIKMEYIAMGFIIKKRTFFGRTFRKISNWFR